MKTHLLFVCTENRHRSPTAERLFERSEKYEAKSCGISPFAERPVTSTAVEWADVIFVMEEFQKEAILQKFPQLKKQIIILHIPDIYPKDDPPLAELLKERLRSYLDEAH